jgi:hypothetical protein
VCPVVLDVPEHRSGVHCSFQETKMLDLWFLNQNTMKQIRKEEEEGYDYCKYWEFKLHEIFLINSQENYLEIHNNFSVSSTISGF